MDQWKKHLYQPEPVSEWIDEAIIVIDTNVLLAAYQWRKITVNEVLQALEIIKKKKRLRIPLQVIKEFSLNRPKQIKQRMNDVDQIISKFQADLKPIIERLPMLQNKDDSPLLVETLRENYNKALKEYKDELLALRNEIKNLFIKDPFLDRLLEICEETVISSEKKLADLIHEASKRFKDKIPPGYKDSSKESNSSGDFLIWSTILEIERDVVFVSGDTKEDWVYSDKNGESIVARQELSQEFYDKTGKRFAHITPTELINHMNPSVSETIREDLERLGLEGESFYENLKSTYSSIYNLLIEICKLQNIECDENNEIKDIIQLLLEQKLISEKLFNKINTLTNLKRVVDPDDENDCRHAYQYAHNVYNDLFFDVYYPIV
ncbi:PIN-like domain-containing protein [Bacillus pumilus]